ncbi:MAG: lactate racemase domain-containing protein [Synergistaceae bacterium]
MSFIEETLKNIPLPKVIKVKQHFYSEKITEPDKELTKQLQNLKEYKEIKAGEKIAITGGSRGIDQISLITKTVCEMIKAKGAYPFIVPAMGSHGGATAQGQKEMLATFGITEKTMEVPIISSMETVQIGETETGRPIYMDKNAHQADGIILINRIKAHTSFKGKYESGLMKMMAIGLGKQKGAQNYHQTGFKELPQIIEEVGNKIIEKEKIKFGIALIENGYNKLCKIESIPPKEIPNREEELLKYSYATLPLPYFKKTDVMIVKEIGKDISGTGHDPNVTGRYNNEHFKGQIHTEKLGILELTKASHGNANGIGMGDFITKKLYKQMDIEQTYPNSLTSTAATTSKIPMIMRDDKQTIQACIKTSCIVDYTKVKLAILENTKNLKTIYVTENMAREATEAGMEIIGKPKEIPFNEKNEITLEFE